jgi:CheY-like chemotaxis protein
MKNELLKGRKILIVEDDISSRLYLNKILERAGAELFNAENGLEAVNMALNNPDIELILMDIQLPVMDGGTAARKIRESGKSIKIIAQTAYGFTSEMEEMLSSGFDDYIIKPIYSDQLINKIIDIAEKK